MTLKSFAIQKRLEHMQYYYKKYNNKILKQFHGKRESINDDFHSHTFTLENKSTRKKSHQLTELTAI